MMIALPKFASSYRLRKKVSVCACVLKEKLKERLMVDH